MPEEGRKITPEMQSAMDKHGGLMPMNITDADSGESIYDNRDATIMATQNAKRGGIAASNYSRKFSNNASFRCHICNDKTCRSFNQLFVIGWICGCGYRHDPVKPPMTLNTSMMYTNYGDFKNNPIEDAIEQWLWREYVIPRYVNYLKSIPNRVLNHCKKGYNILMKKHNNIMWGINVLKESWKRR